MELEKEMWEKGECPYCHIVVALPYHLEHCSRYSRDLSEEYQEKKYDERARALVNESLRHKR